LTRSLRSLINGRPVRDPSAGGAGTAGHRSGTFLAIQRLRQYPGCGCLANPPRPGKKVGMGNLSLRNSVAENTAYWFLPYEVFKTQRSPFSCQHKVAHCSPVRIQKCRITSRERNPLLVSRYCFPATGEQLAAAHRKECLPLLPSGPGGIHTLPLRRAIPRLQENRNVLSVYFSTEAGIFNTCGLFSRKGYSITDMRESVLAIQDIAHKKPRAGTVQVQALNFTGEAFLWLSHPAPGT